jgi:hypothetical protein
MDGCYGISIHSWYWYEYIVMVWSPSPYASRASNFSRFESWLDNPEPWDDDYGTHNQKTDFVQHHGMSGAMMLGLSMTMSSKGP